MAVSIAQMIQFAGPACVQVFNRPTYRFGMIQELPNANAYMVYLYDDATGYKVPVTWSMNDEARNNTEATKIELAKALIENAIHSLNDYIESEMSIKDDVQEVDFSE